MKTAIILAVSIVVMLCWCMVVAFGNLLLVTQHLAGFRR